MPNVRKTLQDVTKSLTGKLSHRCIVWTFDSRWCCQFWDGSNGGSIERKYGHSLPFPRAMDTAYRLLSNNVPFAPISFENSHVLIEQGGWTNALYTPDMIFSTVSLSILTAQFTPINATASLSIALWSCNNCFNEGKVVVTFRWMRACIFIMWWVLSTSKFAAGWRAADLIGFPTDSYHVFHVPENEHVCFKLKIPTHSTRSTHDKNWRFRCRR